MYVVLVHYITGIYISFDDMKEIFSLRLFFSTIINCISKILYLDMGTINTIINFFFDYIIPIFIACGRKLAQANDFIYPLIEENSTLIIAMLLLLFYPIFSERIYMLSFLFVGSSSNREINYFKYSSYLKLFYFCLSFLLIRSLIVWFFPCTDELS